MTKATGSTIAIAGRAESGYTNGTGVEASFGIIRGLASDGTRLYATDATNSRVRTLN